MVLAGEGFAQAELVLEASAGGHSDQIGVLWAVEGGRLWPVDFAVDKVGNIGS